MVESPVVRNAAGEVEFDKNGQAKLVHADLDIRLARDDQAPFPLYPGEVLRQVQRENERDESSTSCSSLH